MDRDISKIRKVLNSVYHDEQDVELSRKSVNFSFFVDKGLSGYSTFTYSKCCGMGSNEDRKKQM